MAYLYLVTSLQQKVFTKFPDQVSAVSGSVIRVTQEVSCSAYCEFHEHYSRFILLIKNTGASYQSSSKFQVNLNTDLLHITKYFQEFIMQINAAVEISSSFICGSIFVSLHIFRDFLEKMLIQLNRATSEFHFLGSRVVQQVSSSIAVELSASSMLQQQSCQRISFFEKQSCQQINFRSNRTVSKFIFFTSEAVSKQYVLSSRDRSKFNVLRRRDGRSHVLSVDQSASFI